MIHGLRAVAAAAMRPARSAARTGRSAAMVLTTVVVAALVVWGVRQRGGSIATVEAPSLVIGRQQQLTAADEIEFDPSFSPGSDLIAYSVGHGARFRLVVREVGTNREIPVPVDQDGLQFQPRWSPDGNTLLYLARDGVFVWPLSGGQRRRVASPSDAPGTYTMFLREGPAITAAAWSPDGREIAVVYGGNLVALEKDGKSRRPLAASPDELHWCDWSPKGTWIACTAGNLHLPYSEHHFGNIAPSSIVLVPTGGGQLIEIAPKTSMNQSPIWSADGRRLYFVSNRHGTSDIYGIDISEDGTPVGNTIRLTTGLGAFSIVMSGDRERLAYAQLAARSNVWSLPIPTNGRLVDIAGARQLTSANQVIEAMHVTPDRKWLVYDSNLHGNSDIFRMPLDGGSRRDSRRTLPMTLPRPCRRTGVGSHFIRGGRSRGISLSSHSTVGPPSRSPHRRAKRASRSGCRTDRSRSSTRLRTPMVCSGEPS